jgi:hypothetical protein
MEKDPLRKSEKIDAAPYIRLMQTIDKKVGFIIITFFNYLTKIYRSIQLKKEAICLYF